MLSGPVGLCEFILVLNVTNKDSGLLISVHKREIHLRVKVIIEARESAVNLSLTKIRLSNVLVIALKFNN